MNVNCKSPVSPAAALGSGGVNSQADLDRLRAPAEGIEGEKARLRKATKEFEAFFMYQMLKTMRKTIPENPLTKDAALGGGMGKDLFTDMFDMEIARQSDFGGHNSISEILYKSLERLIDAKYDGLSADPGPEFKPLDDAGNQPVELGPQPLMPMDDATPEAEPVPLPQEKISALPIETTPRPVIHDPIVSRYGHFIDEAAEETRLDSTLIASVIRAESAGDPQAVSHAGAKGLMQLVDTTAQEMGLDDSFDPRENIRAGSRYLRRMIDRFGSLELGLAAYNAGPGNVRKYGGIPPFAETQAYVKRVTALAAHAEMNRTDGISSEPVRADGPDKSAEISHVAPKAVRE